ncbi:MAG: AsmA family protein [Hyphomicrobiales bacterium]
MRELVTALGIALIAAMLLALAAPLFVNFSDYRDFFETRLSNALGTRVTIRGEINGRFLPFPVVEIGQAQIGEAGSGLELDIERLHLDIAVMPLFKGQVQVLDALASRPTIRVAVDADGRIPAALVLQTGDSGSESEAGYTVGFDRLRLAQAELIVSDASSGEVFSAKNIDLDASAPTFRGPWRIEGTGAVNDQVYAAKLSTGTPEVDGRFRALLSVENAARSLRMDADGMLSFGGLPEFDGKIQLSGAAPWPVRDGMENRPWLIDATVRIEGRESILRSLLFEFGQDQGVMKFEGSGDGVLGAGAGLNLVLSSRQIDLDASLLGEGETTSDLRTTLSAWQSALMMGETDLRAPFPVAVDLKIESILAGGDTLKNVQLQSRVQSDGVVVKGLSAELPGQGNLSANGRAGLARGGQFFGHVVLEAKDTPRLLGWIEGEISGRSNRIGTAKEMKLDADVALSMSVAAASNLNLTLDRSAISGLARYSAGDGGARSRVDAQLASNALIINDLPDVSTLAARVKDVDVALSIDAKNVEVVRASGTKLGQVRLKARSTAEGIDIEALEITNLGGATVSANGRLTETGDRFNAQFDAQRVDSLAVLLGKLMPGPVPEMLAERSASLSPLRLKLSAELGRDHSVALRFDGTAAKTMVAGQAAFSDSSSAMRVAAELKAEGPDPVALLQQIGADVLPLPVEGSANLSLNVNGLVRDGLDMTLQIDAGGMVLDGVFKRGAEGAKEGYKGTFSIRSGDAAPVLQALTFPLPDAAISIPIDLKADVSTSNDLVQLDRITGIVEEKAVSGQLALARSTGKVSGTLEFDRLSLAGLSSFVLGTPTSSHSGGLWSSTRFGAQVQPTFDALVAVRTPEFSLGVGPTAKDASFMVRWHENAFEISDAKAAFADGQMTGSLALRRQDALATYTGKIGMKGVPVRALLPNAGLDGKLDLDVDLGGSGESMAGFAASLAGGGAVKLYNARVEAFDLGALPRLTAVLDAERDPPDLRRVDEMFAKELARAALSTPEIATPVTLSAGTARLGPLAVKVKPNGVEGSLSYDFKVGKFDGRVLMTTEQAPADWTGPIPQAGVSWKSAGGAVERSVDTATLTNVLTTRAVTRELLRIEAFESDLRERNFFIRRLKAERESIEREKRAIEEARLAEEARVKAEAEAARKKAEEEARLKAEEAARLRAEEEAARLKAAEVARLKALAEAARLKEIELNRLLNMPDVQMPTEEELIINQVNEYLKSITPAAP